MTRRPAVTALIVRAVLIGMACSVLSAGCGQTGPLVLPPDDVPPAQTDPDADDEDAG